MEIVDPGNPDAVEEALVMPSVNPLMSRLTRTCSLCYAQITSGDMANHEDWHRALAAAISNAVAEASVVASLLGSHGD